MMIDAQVIRIDVEHEVGEDPVIERALASSAELVAPRLASAGGADRRDLRGIIAKRFHPVLRVIQLAEEAGMRRGQVVALQVIVDVDLPVALDDVVAADGVPQLIDRAAQGSDFARDRPHHFGERRRGGVHVDEDVRSPDLRLGIRAG